MKRDSKRIGDLCLVLLNDVDFHKQSFKVHDSIIDFAFVDYLNSKILTYHTCGALVFSDLLIDYKSFTVQLNLRAKCRIPHRYNLCEWNRGNFDVVVFNRFHKFELKQKEEKYSEILVLDLRSMQYKELKFGGEIYPVEIVSKNKLICERSSEFEVVFFELKV